MIERSITAVGLAELSRAKLGPDHPSSLAAAKLAVDEVTRATSAYYGPLDSELVVQYTKEANILVKDTHAVLSALRTPTTLEKRAMGILGLQILSTQSNSLSDLRYWNPRLFKTPIPDEIAGYMPPSAFVGLNQEYLDIEGTVNMDKAGQIAAIQARSDRLEENESMGMKAVMLPAAMLIQADMEYARIHQGVKHLIPDGRAIRVLDGGLDSDFHVFRTGDGYSISDLASFEAFGVRKMNAVPGIIFYDQEKVEELVR